ncbi:hypothetical protein [Rhodobacter sp. NSM]|uniref:hypothetical protein n=1 Tax=Rhodobacter sp. NSM TaxID=3457501 RepID=UPI003FD0D06B
MHIVYHLGAHCTDEERLLRCLQRNRDLLEAEGIVVPDPARYRTLLRDTAVTLKGAPLVDGAQQAVLDQVFAGARAERAILTWDSFLSYPQWVLRGVFYPAAGERMRALADIFAGHTTEAHLAIRNPATFLPALFQKQRGRSHADFLEGTHLGTLRWSDTIRAIRLAAPDVPLTVWCDEDTPLIWPEVLGSLTGTDPAALEGTDDLLAAIMSAEGLTRLRTALAEAPTDGPIQRRRLISSHLEAYALPDRIEMEFEMPGWSPDVVEMLTRAYDEDVARIQTLQGVSFLAA